MDAPCGRQAPLDGDRSVLVLRDAGLCALEAEACAELQNAFDALEQGNSAPDALQGLCDNLARSLDLALVRLVTADAQAREIAVDDSLRQTLPALMRIRLPDGGCHPSLEPLGVHCAIAWPLAHDTQSCVLALYSCGRDDFKDSPTAEFLSKWLPWMSERLTRCGQRQQQRLLADTLAQAVTPAFITDHEGTIVWINTVFSRQYGYDAAEAIGKTPRILQSGEHSERYYRGLWTAILGGHAWSGRTIDRAADGHLYAVRQTITPLHGDGRVTRFLAIHSDITEDAELAAIADARQPDVLTGLMIGAAFAEYASEALLSARFAGQKWTFC